MIKKIVFALALIAATFLFFKIDSSLKSWLLSFSNSIKSSFLDALLVAEQRIDSFFQQSDKILQLEKELRQMRSYKLLNEDRTFRLKKLQELCDAPFEPQSYNMKLTKMIAYERLGDFTSAWLDAKLQQNAIYGLVTNRGVAGIVTLSQGGVLALFNGNKKCSYTVSIADGIKGIATGSGDNGYILVKYIRSYEEVKPGQRVYTNSYDNIFPYGIDVGVVEKVWQEGSYKVAKVKTSENLKEPLYFWLVQPLSNEVIK